MKMQGYTGSQLWDTAFSVQALHVANVGDAAEVPMRRASHFIASTQARHALSSRSPCYCVSILYYALLCEDAICRVVYLDGYASWQCEVTGNT